MIETVQLIIIFNLFKFIILIFMVELRKLSKQEQLALFDEKNAVELVKEYISYGGDFMSAALRKVCQEDTGKNKMMLSFFDHADNDAQAKIYEALTLEDAEEIFYTNCGIFCPEALIKMTTIFPKSTSKELLVAYAKSGYIPEDVLVKAFSRMSLKDFKEVLMAAGHLPRAVFGKLCKVMSKADLKALVIEIVRQDGGVLADGSQLDFFAVFEKEDIKEILTESITHVGGFADEVQQVILDMWPKEDVKELLTLAIENDQFLSDDVLKEIVFKFSKRDARSLLTKYFRGECGARYDDADIETIMALFDA